MTEYRFRDVNEALPALMLQVLSGEEVDSRGGKVREILFPHVVLTQPWRRDVVVPGRRVSAVAQIAETMWILAGRNDVAWLQHYLPRAADFSDDGTTWRGGYGPRLRNWQGEVDQLAHVVDLLRDDPLTRRAVISLYDPLIDADPGKDVPCNNWLHFLTRGGRLDLHVVIRSNDLMWGWSGINAYEWSALQEIVAGLVGTAVGELHFSVSSLHLYDRHWDRARQIAAETPAGESAKASPRFDSSGLSGDLSRFDEMVRVWFLLEGCLRETPGHPDTLSAVMGFPEPMLRGWLAVVGWWWSRDERFLEPYAETPLLASAYASPGAPRVSFLDYVTTLHADKHAVYGDSWKRRGEEGIQANIARKVDRLGVGGAGDTAADTVVDLLVYLVKYRLWLTDEEGELTPGGVGLRPRGKLSDQVQPVSELLARLDHGGPQEELDGAAEWLAAEFEALPLVTLATVDTVDGMLPVAYALAEQLWTGEQK